MTAMTICNRAMIVAVLTVGSTACGTATAQNLSTFGQTWSSGWGFSSASDRSVALQEAQLVENAENGPAPTAVTTYNTYTDNRANYVETNADGGTVSTDLHVGDDIGQQTYAVGALNTGNTSITVDGSGNSIAADNTAATSGCVDGSIASYKATQPAPVTATTGDSGANTLPYVTVVPANTTTRTCN